MRIRGKVTAALLLLTTAGCGGGGGGEYGSGNTANPVFGTVNLLSHTPTDGALQVELGAVIKLSFDSEMVLETFADDDTWLQQADSGSNIPVTFTRGLNGGIDCRPNSDLEPETDYVFQLSALVSDVDGQILDATTSFTFRTFDATHPSVTGCSIVNGSNSVSRTDSITLSFDEAIAQDSINAASLYLRDGFGGRFACDCTADGQTILIDPYTDLPGNRQFFVVATVNVTDRAGNQLAAQYQVTFRTIVDAQSPTLVTQWPLAIATGVSPNIHPTFSFSESMDAASVEAVSLRFQDEYGSLIGFTVDASIDQRTLRLRPNSPLNPNRDYSIEFLLGSASATDVSGNGLQTTQVLAFTTGTDTSSPTVLSSSPTANETRVPGSLIAEVQFTEELNSNWVNDTTIQLTVDNEPWPAVIDLVDDTIVRVTPVMALPVATTCDLTLRGGQDGLHDVAGNVLAVDTKLTFTTSNDAESPDALILPPDGSSSIATGSVVSIVFDAAMDPETLNSSTILVTDDAGNPIDGQRVISAENRMVTFTPDESLTPNDYYRVKVVSGHTGARRVSGNWFDTERLSRFRVGQVTDTVPPTITASVNGIPAARRDGLVLPPSGFTIDISTTDTSSQWVDMGSVVIELQGSAGPTSESLLAAATIDYESIQVKIPTETPLSDGSWTLTVSANDLSGNTGQSNVVSFEVDAPSTAAMPFERTQVVWVRMDLDRDENGQSDFAEDMLRLGFNSAGDPHGTNVYMSALLQNGILAKASHLYHRDQRSEPIDADSVPLRFSNHEPILLPHMQIALGGLDPEGDANRSYGAESTGVLGRAYYDYRNNKIAERNTSNSPGLGVFPAEMFLYQTHIHEQVYPSFQTRFASKFLPLCPSMGGTPAGSDPLDAIVLNASFDYDNANSSERARFTTIMNAADDWSAAMGVILAHEVGHSIGLVAPGPMPNGLFGDSSLHNTYVSAAEVMSSAVGYESMATLDYQFRDIDLAYLRQRILMR
ncbi:Ig-like domain-containing protein [bacterium]|nr:Ig-like domain-containing protein [bacterium]